MGGGGLGAGGKGPGVAGPGSARAPPWTAYAAYDDLRTDSNPDGKSANPNQSQPNPNPIPTPAAHDHNQARDAQDERARDPAHQPVQRRAAAQEPQGTCAAACRGGLVAVAAARSGGHTLVLGLGPRAAAGHEHHAVGPRALLPRPSSLAIMGGIARARRAARSSSGSLL